MIPAPDSIPSALFRWDFLVGLVAKASVLRVADVGLIPAFCLALFLGRGIPVT